MSKIGEKPLRIIEVEPLKMPRRVPRREREPVRKPVRRKEPART